MTTQLADCIARHQGSIPGLAELGQQLDNLMSKFPLPLRERDRVRGKPGAEPSSLQPSAEGAGFLETLIALYDQCHPLLERAMWSDAGDFHALLASYQAVFREQEALIAQRGGDARHDFIISIPVADRPPHLSACLESLYQLCRLYDYGGKTDGVWGKIKVVVAEDSREQGNIRRHLELVEEYRQKGLQVCHFDLAEQYDLLHALPAATRERLGNLLTTQPRETFHRKGQAANRNLSYLKCLQLTEDKARTLYYLVDSDQHFCVNRQSEAGEEAAHALNYFYYLDRIFRGSDTLMLTGKMVGDPPVSPSVMAGNFLDDVSAFFERLATLGGGDACRFHGARQKPGDAAYHDMAGLFGYEYKQAAFDYVCRLEGAHDHADCLADFATRLKAFFFGEHPTRKTWFRYDEGFMRLSPARTVYPGNTVVNYAGLKYVIPFGHLRLRMSGPTAGRLIAAEIGPRFASANLPNLHRRTTAAGLEDDFRPGVELGEDAIDVSDEFERQFFGDLMLFSTEELVKRADVKRPFARAAVEAVIMEKEAELLALYQQKHDAIVARSRQLRALVFDAGHWWLAAAEHSPEVVSALGQVRAFIDNIERNFGELSPAWQQIQSAAHRAARRQQIMEALMSYRAEREAWDSLF